MANKKILEPLKVKRVGAPNKPVLEIKDSNTGLTTAQKEWIIKEAKGRKVHRTDIMREAMDMYISAAESQRDEVLTVDDVNKDIVTQTKSK